jgi:GNAT superfamily N-acetyltransferase
MTFREARKSDVPEIVKLLAEDTIGKVREQYTDPLPQYYYDAFDRIAANENEMLLVVENDDGEVVGTLQLTFLQHLSYRGRLRAQIESVRIREDSRNKGLGQQMIEWAIRLAKDRNAHVVQLASDKKRRDAIRFYERIGFKPTHEGMKLYLD